MGENRCACLAAAACGFVLGAIVVKLLGNGLEGCCSCGYSHHGHGRSECCCGGRGSCCCGDMEEDCGCGPGCGCGCAADEIVSEGEAASAE